MAQMEGREGTESQSSVPPRCNVASSPQSVMLCATQNAPLAFPPHVACPATAPCISPKCAETRAVLRANNWKTPADTCTWRAGWNNPGQLLQVFSHIYVFVIMRRSSALQNWVSVHVHLHIGSWWQMQILISKWRNLQMQFWGDSDSLSVVLWLCLPPTLAHVT